MTIVCGTDFSDNAAQAARAAASIARCLNDRLELVHVLSDPAVAGIPALGMFYAPLQELLAEQARKLAGEFAILVNPSVLEGPADERLVQFARDANARLIVVSSLGSRKQEHWRVGSVAERVLQRSGTPVLVVRQAASIEQWAEGKRPLRILLGVDLGQSARAALHWVEALRQIRPCDVRVVQVAWPIGEHARFGVKGPIELEGLRPELHASNETCALGSAPFREKDRSRLPSALVGGASTNSSRSSRRKTAPTCSSWEPTSARGCRACGKGPSRAE
jgi:nucleotide-binding universal stress UspA family protein